MASTTGTARTRPRETAKWRKPAARPSGPRPTTKTASSSSRRNSASSAITKPRSGWSPRQLAPRSPARSKRGLDLARVERGRRVAGAFEPVHRLPHLANRPPLERERRRRRRPPRRRDTARAGRARGSARASPSEAPRIAIAPVRACANAMNRSDDPVEAARAVPSDPRRRSQRRRRPCTRRRPLVIGEEIRLVRAQHERRERIRAPCSTSVAGELAVARFFAHAGNATARASRAAGSPTALSAEQRRLTAEPFAERSGQMVASRARSRRRRGALPRHAKRERERLVGHHSVHPERARTHSRRSQQPKSSARNTMRGCALRIARRVELGAPRKQRDRHEPVAIAPYPKRCCKVQRNRARAGRPAPPAMRAVSHARGRVQRRGAPVRAARRALRKHRERVRSKRGDQRGPFVREHGVEHAEQACGCDEPCEHERTSRAAARAPARTQCAREPGKRRRQVDRLLSAAA